MKKVCLIIIISLLLIIGILTKSNKTEEPQTIEPNKTLAIYIENDNCEYEVYNGSSWPTVGYILDTTQSKCENGGLLSWDNANKKIALNSSEVEKCYVYFKKEPAVKYWNDSFGNHEFAYPSTPTTRYYTSDEIPEISTKPIFIRTDETSHATCLRYNNKDFCLPYGYGKDMTGDAIKPQLQADMESAFETTATSCGSGSSYARCYFGGFYCGASLYGNVYCNDGQYYCIVNTAGNATCN